MKKALSIILALAMMLSILSAIGVSAFADDEPDEPIVIAAPELTFTGREVNAYVFVEEATTSIYCLFPDVLPDVLYITPEDYLNVIYTDQFTAEYADGVYTVTNAYGVTMTLDAANNTLYVEDYDSFSDCFINQEGSSVEINYVKYKDGDYSVLPHAVTIDLGAYGVDVLEEDGKVYLPLTVIAAMFSITYNNAVYMDGDIYFVHTFDPESFYDYEVDQSPLYEETERSPEMAQFTYNTLCLFFDYFFGKPSNAILAETLNEKGLDAALDEFDELTPFIKELLLSENRSEYLTGLAALGIYLYDGGHTVLLNTPVIGLNYYSETPLMSLWYDDIMDETDVADLFWDTYYYMIDLYNYGEPIAAARAEAYEAIEDEIVHEWEEDGAFLIIHGDTAVFVFDSFEEDTPYDFKEALDIAAEAGCVNFLIDDSLNGGGYVAANNYICCLLANSAETRSNVIYNASENPFSGSVYEYSYYIDLNLDGEFDDADCEVYYDFNFAVLTSGYAFSCGNALPIMAGRSGVMVIGEPSSGGSCYVTERYLADGLSFPIGDIGKTVLPDGTDVDLGAPVDVDLRKIDDEGNVDYSGFYDLDAISALIKEFYGESGVIYGDVNDDGAVNKKDSLRLKQYLADPDNNAVNLAAADVNDDGAVNKKDSLRLKQYLAGWDVVLGPEAVEVA